jgi:hypothetical protein
MMLFVDPSPRPELRQPKRTASAIYRVRVDLDHSSPPIWRRLDLRSDLPLDVVHHVLQAAVDLDDAPTAVLVDGERAAPPEDCGGLTDEEHLARVLDDPALLCPDAITTALRGSFFVMHEAGFDRRLIELIQRLEHTHAGADWTDRVARLIARPTTLSDDEVMAALRPYRWFLDRAADAGIPLTSAGYLKPADVTEASKRIPAMGDWIGSNNREVNCAPLLNFRLALQSLGLLRKYKGSLLIRAPAPPPFGLRQPCGLMSPSA